MKAIAAAVAFALLAGCFGGSKDAGKAEVPVMGTIVGFVLDEAIKPLAGANVTIPGNVTQTDATGRFTFGNLTPGSYVITAAAPTYLVRQTTVVVVAGNVSEAKLVLPVDPTTLVFNQTYTFTGFASTSLGSSGPDVGGECRCNFTIPLDPAWRSIVIEAQWEDSVSSPAAPTEFSWSLPVAGNPHEGQGPSPLLGRVDGNATAGETAVVHIEPASPHVYFNQQFAVSVTVFYGQPAPTGWHTLG